MEKAKSSRHGFKRTLSFIFFYAVVSVFASQCFAQSQALTADQKSQRDRQYLEIINSLYYYIQQNYIDEVDAEKLYEGALKGMIDSLDDPYSQYLSKDDWRSLSDKTVGTFGGVGLSITKPTENKPDKPAYVEVAQPIDDSPGAKAGIQPGDFIIKIDGVDTSTLTMNEVLDRLRGTVGEPVTVTIKRGKKMEFDCTLIRALIENPTVKAGMIRDTLYIRLSEFGSTTADKVKDALDKYRRNYKSIILDLRNNGGGLLTSAYNIADMFIDDGVIVATKSRIAYENSVYTASKRNTEVPGEIPLIVLINGASASASEILAGALKDAHRAYLVGEKSFGKGSVQIPTPLINNDGFKITVAKYYSPTDVNIDKVGIPPDREVAYPEFSDEESEAFSTLMSSDTIEKYVEDHPGMGEVAIASYAKELQKTYKLDLRTLRKLVRNEVQRTQKSPLYDLDYDLQLNAALGIFAEEDYDALMSQAKDLKQLETERLAKESQTAKAE
ncbi:MAG: S41 family peptidase [Treponema sp.]|nr:S41 family peptidase [Treponema sp.]MCR5622817.1 S41 family peptidase [Treponema sp.]